MRSGLLDRVVGLRVTVIVSEGDCSASRLLLVRGWTPVVGSVGAIRRIGIMDVMRDSLPGVVGVELTFWEPAMVLFL